MKPTVEEFSKAATDAGAIIEAGWVGLRLAAIPHDASEIQLDEMRMAFFAGAQHLFTSILTILDPESEPTDADLARMSRIDDELRAFAAQFKLKHTKTEGSA